MATSEYLQREQAAKKQLGSKGVKKRVRQLPTAARATLKEMTGVDISRKGVSVDPFSVAIALPVGRVLKAAKVVRAAMQAGKVESAAKSFQLYQGKSVRVGTFNNITQAKARAQGLIDLNSRQSGRVYSGPDFRVVDPVTGKTIIRIR